jgi:preprotein translocase subunit SecY
MEDSGAQFGQKPDSWRNMPPMRRISPVSWVLIVIGVVFVVVGVIYMTQTPPHLPSFLPGHVKVGVVFPGRKHPKYQKKYTKRGIASFVVAAGAFVGVFYKDFRH